MPEIKVERAKMTDVPEIYNLINYYAEEGLMLAKSYSFIYENLRQYMVIRDEGKVVAVGGLRLFWLDLAEICSLAVNKDYLGRGLGRAIVGALEEEAKALGLPQVFALTYKEGFFERCGYHMVALSGLPQKIWKDCVHCPRIDNCGEVAMMKIF